MYDHGFLDIKDKPSNEWWQTKSISSLPIGEPITVLANTTIQSVLDIMYARGSHQIPVISDAR